MSITKLLLTTDRCRFSNQFPKGESPVGRQKPVPLSTLPFCVGLNTKNAQD